MFFFVAEENHPFCMETTSSTTEEATFSQLIPLILGIASALILWYVLMGNESSSKASSASAAPEEDEDPPRCFTPESMRVYDGVQKPDTIYIALKGKVYDVTRGKSFYGPGGSYHIFAGRDASRGLAKMSLDIADVDEPKINDLSLSELDELQSWSDRIAAKYKCVGWLVDEAERRDYTLEELRQYDGNNTDKPLLLVMRGVVYDVTKGKIEAEEC